MAELTITRAMLEVLHRHPGRKASQARTLALYLLEEAAAQSCMKRIERRCCRVV
jgi:hypothetical protein